MALTDKQVIDRMFEILNSDEDESVQERKLAQFLATLPDEQKAIVSPDLFRSKQ